MSVKSTRMVNELADVLLGSPVVAGVVSSAFYTAIVIVIIITLLASFVYRDSEDRFRKAIRLLFWATVFTSAVFMLRDRYVSTAAAAVRTDTLTHDVFEMPAQLGPAAPSVGIQYPTTTPQRQRVSDEQLADLVSARGYDMVRRGSTVML